MRTTVTTIIFLIAAQVLQAQIQLPIKLVSTPAVLQQIINGVSNEFENAKTDALVSSPQQVDYKTSLTWPNSEENIVTIYPSGKTKIRVGNASWQSVLVTTESFKDASKLFKKTFQQINGAQVSYSGTSYKLNASYEAPDEAVGFSTIVFEQGKNKRLQIQLELNSDGINWQVKLNIFEVQKMTD